MALDVVIGTNPQIRLFYPGASKSLKKVRKPFQENSIRVPYASGSNSYLAGRDELQGTKGGLQVLCVALEVEESAGDRGLQLGGVLPGWRVGGDLVDGSHYCERRGAAGSAGGDVDGGEVRRLNGWQFPVGSALSLRARYFLTGFSVSVLGLYCDWLAVCDCRPTIALALSERQRLQSMQDLI